MVEMTIDIGLAILLNVIFGIVGYAAGYMDGYYSAVLFWKRPQGQ